jgi:hypothetical protein
MTAIHSFGNGTWNNKLYSRYSASETSSSPAVEKHIYLPVEHGQLALLNKFFGRAFKNDKPMEDMVAGLIKSLLPGDGELIKIIDEFVTGRFE